MYEWSDLRIFLAVVDAGSALGAARHLGINQSTVNRRVQALEHALGLRLFERGSRGHDLARDGQALISAVRHVEQAANDVQFAAERLRRIVSGTVRVTAPEALANSVITPIISGFHSLHPDIRIEQVAADQRLDVVHGEADVAFRAGSHPNDPRLIARRLPDTIWATYCSPAYAEKHGRASSVDALEGHDIVAYTGTLAQLPSQVWLMSSFRGQSTSYTSNTVPSMCALLRSGFGLGILPRFVGDADNELLHCFDAPADVSSELWLITSAESGAEAHVRAFIDYAVPKIEAMKDVFRGAGQNIDSK